MIISLRGGLGNQIFQLGAGFLFKQSSIILDDGALGNYDVKRENELLNFFDFTKLDLSIKFETSILSKYRLPKLLPFKFSKYPFVSDKNFQILSKNINNRFLLLDGYFQACLTQENFDEEVKLLKIILINKQFEAQDGCVIHIRGGDFVKLGWNSITPKEYYIKAIETMQLKYNQTKFYIVTDDRIYSKSVLDNINIDYKFIGNSIYEDFHLLGSFKYRILSASTFALWASALGVNDGGDVVIAPNEFTPGIKRDFLLPNERRSNA